MDLDENNAVEGLEQEENSEDADMDVDEEEEGEDDEFIDVLDILDGRGVPDNGSETEDHMGTASSNKPRPQTDDDDGSSGEEEEDEGQREEEESGPDSDDQDAFAPSDEEDSAPEALGGLHAFISTLDTTAQKRKLPAEDPSSRDKIERPRKRRMLKERTEAGAENEFRAQPSGTLILFDFLLCV